MNDSYVFKFCPFCGNVDQETFTILDFERVECYQCGAVGPLRDEPDEAVEAWNKRADESK